MRAGLRTAESRGARRWPAPGLGRAHEQGVWERVGQGGTLSRTRSAERWTGWELNVFVQRRALNRGWSEAGKLYREMEKYCVLNPSTFCFIRPLYVDPTAKPAFVEFGLLKNDGKLWV